MATIEEMYTATSQASHSPPACHAGGRGFEYHGRQIIRERGASILVDSYVTDYDASDGASLSAPHVAVIAALVIALRPDLSAPAKKRRRSVSR